MIRGLRIWADRLINLSAFVGTVGIIAELVVILIDVIGRYFGKPLLGAQDISTMGFVLIVFGGMALCYRRGGHVSVDILETTFPSWLNRAGDMISALLGAAIFAGIAWTMWQSAAISEMLNLATNIINLPKAWFQYVVVIMSIITALGMLLHMIEILTRTEPPKPETADGPIGNEPGI